MKRIAKRTKKMGVNLYNAGLSVIHIPTVSR